MTTDHVYQVKDAGGVRLGASHDTETEAFAAAADILRQWGERHLHSTAEWAVEAASEALLAADGLHLSRDAWLAELRQKGWIKLRYGTRAVVIQRFRTGAQR